MSRFESSITEGKFLEIDWADDDGSIGLGIIHSSFGDMGRITLSVSDVPALMVELARAAGLDKIIWGKDEVGTFKYHMHQAVLSLEKAIGARRDAEAAAKEQAELEAEALALFNALRDSIDVLPIASFSVLSDPVKARWLAVARKAREMRGDK